MEVIDQEGFRGRSLCPIWPSRVKLEVIVDQRKYPAEITLSRCIRGNGICRVTFIEQDTYVQQVVEANKKLLLDSSPIEKPCLFHSSRKNPNLKQTTIWDQLWQ